MKKLLFSFLGVIVVIMINAQQMNTTINGSTVTFSANTGTDWNSTPMYLYAYVDATDTTPNGSGSTQVLGNWPGTEMTGAGPYSVSTNLADYFPAGTTINNIKFIYTNGGVGGTTYQNPAGGQPGFSTTDATKASGWSSVTISSLGVLDLQKREGKAVVASGKLFTSKKVNIDVVVYDLSGKVIQKMTLRPSESGVDLNVQQSGMYIVQVSDGKEIEVVKFRK